MPGKIVKIIQRCFVFEAKKRIGIEEILEEMKIIEKEEIKIEMVNESPRSKKMRAKCCHLF